MIQNIIKVGNSLAVTLPASFVRESKLKAGDKMVVEQNVAHKMLVINPQESAETKHLTPEFFSWLEKFTKKHADVLKELANTP